MSYLPKLAPTVGNGLGGMPERRAAAPVSALNFGLAQRSGNFWRRLYGNILLGSNTELVWNGNIFLGLGGSTATFSADGLNWTSGTQPDMTLVQDVTWGNSLFVGIGGTASTSQRVITSPDGVAWTLRTTPTSASGYTTCKFANGIFAALGFGTEAMSSTNGTIWTARTKPSTGNTNYKKIAHGNGVFVAVGYGGISSVNPVLTSTNGTTWASSVVPNKDWYGVAWNGNIFCAVGNGSVMTSEDGIIWTERACPTNQEWRDVEWNGTVFAAVSRAAAFASGTAPGYRVMTSPDGINWTSKPSAFDADWNSIVSNNDIFVAAGANAAMTTHIEVT